jgi:hypothetical protein
VVLVVVLAEAQRDTQERVEKVLPRETSLELLSLAVVAVVVQADRPPLAVLVVEVQVFTAKDQTDPVERTPPTRRRVAVKVDQAVVTAVTYFKLGKSQHRFQLA